MGIAAVVACAEELGRELSEEIERARGERLSLKSLDAAGIEARVAERRAFQERAEVLQVRLRALLAEEHLSDKLPHLSDKPGDLSDKLAHLSDKQQDAATLAQRLGALRELARQLSQLNAQNQQLAERALSMTRAYVRVLAPRPSAYDCRGAESVLSSALSSISRRA